MLSPSEQEVLEVGAVLCESERTCHDGDRCGGKIGTPQIKNNKENPSQIKLKNVS